MTEPSVELDYEPHVQTEAENFTEETTDFAENLSIKFSREPKLQNNLNRRHKIYKTSCLKCSEEVSNFQKQLEEIKKEYFSNNNKPTKNDILQIMITLDIEKSNFLAGQEYIFKNFQEFEIFLENNNLIPKFSTLLSVQDILKNEEPITLEIGIRFRIAGDHPVEDKLAGRNAGICVRCTIKDKPDAYMLSREHSISPTVCNPVIQAANSYDLRTLKRSFENNKNLLEYFEKSNKMQLQDCKSMFPLFEHQESLPILFVEMIEYALRDFHDMLNESKHVKSLIRQMCRDFCDYLREEGALPVFNNLHNFCLQLQSKIDSLNLEIANIEKTTLAEAKEVVKKLKSQIKYYSGRVLTLESYSVLDEEKITNIKTKIGSLKTSLLEKQNSLLTISTSVITKKRESFRLQEQLDETKISLLKLAGPFEKIFNKACDDLGIQDGLFNNGVSAYTFFAERDKILTCFDPQEFTTSDGRTIVFPPNNFTKNLISAYMLKIWELNQCTKPAVGSFCSHDVSRITEIVIDLGKMYHLLVPLKVRHSAHQRLAHVVEYVLHHGDNLPSERPCEHNHQFLKKADRETIYVRNSKKLETLIAIAVENMKKNLQ